MKNPESVIEFQHLDWSSIPVERIGEGIERQMIWGERLMLCRLRFAPHVVTELHSHPHEQITLVERGCVLFTIEGQQRVVSAGGVLCVPSGLKHGATILDEEVVLIDVFTPVRKDLLPPALPRRSSPPFPGAEEGHGDH